MRCIRNSKKILYFLGKSHALIIPHSIHSFVVIVFRHIPKNDIPLFEKVQQTHFLVWDTPDHTNIHMFINLNSINEDNLYGFYVFQKYLINPQNMSFFTCIVQVNVNSFKLCSKIMRQQFQRAHVYEKSSDCIRIFLSTFLHNNVQIYRRTED